jgi:hypothetical protein
VDLGDFGLAAGQQVWIKQEFKPRDAETLLLHDKLATRE